MLLQNRYEFLFYIQCIDGNPNGDPDTGGFPRIDPEDRRGFITDTCLKRRIRDYIQAAFSGEPGMSILVQNGRASSSAPAPGKVDMPDDPCAKIQDRLYAARQWICSRYFDARAFGAVMTSGPQSGQIRGPVQLAFARSLDPVLSIPVTVARSSLLHMSEDSPPWSRRRAIAYGLYEARGFLSANLARETGFSEEDRDRLFEAILSMYEYQRSSAGGQLSIVSPLILFRHTGTDSDAAQRARQARLGCAPAHRLFELVSVSRKETAVFPRSRFDYRAQVRLSDLPDGVEMGFFSRPGEPVTWGRLPEQEDWFEAV